MPVALLPAGGLAVLVGFAIGSIPFAWLVVRVRTGRDLSRSGSGNVGALNSLKVSRSVWTALLVLALDAGKGVAAAFAARHLVAPSPADLAAVVGAVAGHAYNPWLSWGNRRLTGGKGFATAAGGLLVCAPWMVAAWLAIVALAWAWVRAARGIRDEAPASALATLLLPATAAILYGVPEILAGAGLAAVILPKLLPEALTVWRTGLPAVGGDEPRA